MCPLNDFHGHQRIKLEKTLIVNVTYGANSFGRAQFRQLDSNEGVTKGRLMEDDGSN